MLKTLAIMAPAITVRYYRNYNYIHFIKKQALKKVTKPDLCIYTKQNISAAVFSNKQLQNRFSMLHLRKRYLLVIWLCCIKHDDECFFLVDNSNETNDKTQTVQIKPRLSLFSLF